MHLDLTVGFPVLSYTVDKSANLAVEVSVLADKNGHITDAGLPLGVRVTSRDGSAVGEHSGAEEPLTGTHPKLKNEFSLSV